MVSLLARLGSLGLEKSSLGYCTGSYEVMSWRAQGGVWIIQAHLGKTQNAMTDMLAHSHVQRHPCLFSGSRYIKYSVLGSCLWLGGHKNFIPSKDHFLISSFEPGTDRHWKAKGFKRVNEELRNSEVVAMRSALGITRDQKKCWKFFPGKVVWGGLDVSGVMSEPSSVEVIRYLLWETGFSAFRSQKAPFAVHVSRRWGQGGWGIHSF